jgi:hypothetical protein
MIVVILAFGAVMIMRSIPIGNHRTSTNTCIGNLMLVDGAKQQWALDHQKQSTDTPTTSDLQPYMSRPDGGLPSCPNDPKQSFDTSYSINNVASKPVCKISPTNHILP